MTFTFVEKHFSILSQLHSETKNDIEPRRIRNNKVENVSDTIHIHLECHCTSLQTSLHFFRLWYIAQHQPCQLWMRNHIE